MKNFSGIIYGGMLNLIELTPVDVSERPQPKSYNSLVIDPKTPFEIKENQEIAPTSPCLIDRIRESDLALPLLGHNFMIAPIEYIPPSRYDTIKSFNSVSKGW